MSRHDEHCLKIKNIFLDSVIVLGVYINSKTLLEYKNVLCGHTWKSAPVNVIKGRGCAVCHIRRKTTNEDYIKEVNRISSGSIVPIDLYIDDCSKIKHRCALCDHNWMVTPTSVRQGHGCPKCSVRRISSARRKTAESYEIEVAKIHNCRISVTQPYLGARIPIMHKCAAFGHVWPAMPTNILKGKACPKCRTSRGELQVMKTLDKYAIKYIDQEGFKGATCGILRARMKFDFYLPSKNTCIEYDGEQHFSPIEVFGGEEAFQHRVGDDEIKNMFCDRNNISLIRIAYTEFNDIEKILCKELDLQISP